MAQINPTGIDLTTGQRRQLTSSDTLADAGGGSLAVGDLILIEKKEITSHTATTTFSGLDGNTDGIYVLQSFWVSDTAASPLLYLNPNGLTTNQISESANLSTSYGWANSSRNLIADNFTTTNQSYCVTHIWARAAGPGATSLRRLFKTNHQRGRSTFMKAGEWSDTSTNLTSLVLESSVASNIRIGSTFILYKLASA